MTYRILAILLVISFTVFSQDKPETHFKNLRQLTFGGDNAEAYFSPNGKMIAYQSNNPKWNLSCDQIFMMNLKKGLGENPDERPQFISTGKGRTTCSFFMPDNKHILSGSTHEGG